MLLARLRGTKMVSALFAEAQPSSDYLVGWGSHFGGRSESKTWFVPGRDLDNRSGAGRSTVAELSDSWNTSAPGRTAQP